MIAVEDLVFFTGITRTRKVFPIILKCWEIKPINLPCYTQFCLYSASLLSPLSHIPIYFITNSRFKVDVLLLLLDANFDIT